MRELNNVELEEVNGGIGLGFGQEAGGLLGGGIGAVVDWSNGSNTGAANVGALLGGGIGAVVDASVAGLTSVAEWGVGLGGYIASTVGKGISDIGNAIIGMFNPFK
ncbi:hypothetical protein AAEY27_00810 [Kosakonia sp. BYX6]|uniref:Bacteriocin n=1 Tax=Kosakonia calanthes TaxID=3139408 RepID=A0ABZ3B551_9ENTR